MLKLRKQRKMFSWLLTKSTLLKVCRNGLEYSFTGFKNIFPISAVSGMGTGDLLDGITDSLKKQGFGQIEKDPSTISVAILGKPNVGKSSLFNKIIGEERVVVSKCSRNNKKCC